MLQYYQYSINSKDWLLVEGASKGQYFNSYVDLMLKTTSRFYP